MTETINRLLWKNAENPWKPVETLQAPGKLTERYSLPVIVKEQLAPVEIIHTNAGAAVLDFGQDHAGYMEFDAGFESGTRITIECGEILQDGNFYHDNYRDAKSVFSYTSDGRKETVLAGFHLFRLPLFKGYGMAGRIEEGGHPL